MPYVRSLLHCLEPRRSFAFVPSFESQNEVPTSSQQRINEETKFCLRPDEVLFVVEAPLRRDEVLFAAEVPLRQDEVPFIGYTG